MSGWNLPPGVSERDIPGNRPEDLADEAFWEQLDDRVADENLLLPEGWQDDEAMVRLVEIVRDIGYQAGRQAEAAEAALERVLSEHDPEEA